MITISIMLANIMQGVDNTILNVALPHIQGSLSGERMEALPTMRRFRAAESPYGPIEHARKWAVSHRPK